MYTNETIVYVCKNFKHVSMHVLYAYAVYVCICMIVCMYIWVE